MALLRVSQGNCVRCSKCNEPSGPGCIGYACNGLNPQHATVFLCRSCRAVEAAAANPVKARLLAFYKDYGVQRTEADIDGIVEKYGVDPETLFASLERKYGPPKSAAAAAPLPVIPPTPCLRCGQRMRSVIDTHGPRLACETCSHVLAASAETPPPPAPGAVTVIPTHHFDLCLDCSRGWTALGALPSCPHCNTVLEAAKQPYGETPFPCHGCGVECPGKATAYHCTGKKPVIAVKPGTRPPTPQPLWVGPPPKCLCCQERMRAGPDPYGAGTGFDCDICHKRFGKTVGAFHCEKESIDLCVDCCKPRAKFDPARPSGAEPHLAVSVPPCLKCSNAMRLMKDPYQTGNGFSCDSCGKTFDKSHLAFHCCEVDLCLKCGEKRATAPPPPPPPVAQVPQEQQRGVWAPPCRKCQQPMPVGRDPYNDGSGFKCDICGKTNSPSTFGYHCHDYDICIECGDAQRPKQHKPAPSPVPRQQQQQQPSAVTGPPCRKCKKAMPTATDPYSDGSGFTCDECGKTFGTTVACFHCHGYDLCQACGNAKIPKVAAPAVSTSAAQAEPSLPPAPPCRKCKKPMPIVTDPYSDGGGFSCDECGTKYPATAPAFHCHEYDLCQKCGYAKAPAVAPRSAAVTASAANGAARNGSSQQQQQQPAAAQAAAPSAVADPPPSDPICETCRQPMPLVCDPYHDGKGFTCDRCHKSFTNTVPCYHCHDVDLCAPCGADRAAGKDAANSSGGGWFSFLRPAPKPTSPLTTATESSKTASDPAPVAAASNRPAPRRVSPAPAAASPPATTTAMAPLCPKCSNPMPTAKDPYKDGGGFSCDGCKQSFGKGVLAYHCHDHDFCQPCGATKAAADAAAAAPSATRRPSRQEAVAPPPVKRSAPPCPKCRQPMPLMKDPYNDRGGFTCDSCQKSYDMHAAAYHCHDHDLCESCYDSASSTAV